MKFLTDNFGTPGFYLPQRKGSGSGTPDVILIQGFGNSSRAMNSVRKHLSQEGLNAAAAPLGGLFGYLQTRGIKTGGRRLEQYLSTLPDGHRPWLVAHSIGGIIARWAIQEEGAGRFVRGLITIGTPHRGTPAAIAGLFVGLGVLSSAPYQMVPLSPAIRRLNQAPWPEDVSLLSIVSKRDPLCIHPFGMVPFADDNQVRCQVMRGLRHTEMLRDPEVLAAVMGEIRG